MTEPAPALDGSSILPLNADARIDKSPFPACKIYPDDTHASAANPRILHVVALRLRCGDIDAPGGNVHFAKPKLNNVLGRDFIARAQHAKILGLTERPLGHHPFRQGAIRARKFHRALEKDVICAPQQWGWSDHPDSAAMPKLFL